MKLLRDVVCQYRGKGQGCSLISATLVDFAGVVPLAKGGRPQQTVVNNQAPWSDQQDYLRGGFAVASGLHSAPRTVFPGQTYASFSPQTENALNLTEQRALSGSPVQRSANQELMKTLGGDYLYGGPGFNAAYQAAANEIIPGVESRFNAGGRFGSGLARQAETKALADAFASQYGNERQNQMRAMLFAPEAAQADYNDLRALAGVGSQREGQTQSAIDEAMMRHNFPLDEGWDRLARYMGMVQGNYGGETLQNTYGPRGNRGAGILGGALAGGAAGAPLGPWGAGIGAGLGALGGLF